MADGPADYRQLEEMLGQERARAAKAQDALNVVVPYLKAQKSRQADALLKLIEGAGKSVLYMCLELFVKEYEERIEYRKKDLRNTRTKEEKTFLTRNICWLRELVDRLNKFLGK